MERAVSAPLLLVLVSTGLALATDSALLSAGETWGAAGACVILPVTLESGENLSALQFTLEFDPQRVSVSQIGAAMAGDLCTDHDILTNIQDGRLNVTIFSGALSTFRPGTGSVAQVVFQISPSTQDSVAIGVDVSNAVGSTRDGLPVALTTAGGQIHVGSAAVIPNAGQNEIFFPQVANGDLGAAGSFRTKLLLINRTPAGTSARVCFYSPDGQPQSLGVSGAPAGPCLSVTVPAGGSAFIETDGQGTFSYGYARVTATAPLGGSALFAWLDPAGRSLTEAGVESASPKRSFAIPVLYRKEVCDTGFAVANPSSGIAGVTLSLRNHQNLELGVYSFVLQSGEHKAAFAKELFPLMVASDLFEGTIHVSSASPVVAVTLKQFSGGMVTTLPVVP